MKSLLLAAACAFGAMTLPAAAAVQTVNFTEYTLSYENSSALGGLAFTSGGSGGSLGFGWNIPDTVEASDTTLTVTLPSFTLTAAPGYLLKGTLSGFFGNLSFAEGFGGTSSASIAGSVSIDGGAAMAVGGALDRTLITNKPAIRTGYYGLGGDLSYGTFSTLSVSGLTLTLSANEAASVYSANQGKLEIGFFAIPVPEPESYAMLLAGLGVVSMIARRRLSR